jgi:tetratricopeptide (TPR) repeat protein
LKLTTALQAGILVLAAGCSSPGYPGVPDSYEVDEVPQAIAQARQELANGEVDPAFFRAYSANKTRAVSNEVRAEAQLVLDQAARTRMEQSTDPEALEEMLELDLPSQIAVSAGVRAARLYYDMGERMQAYKLIEKVDQKYPHHHERVKAGRLLTEIGFSLAADRRRYKIFFHYRSLAPGVLEYLVLNYPSAPRGDEAYWTLGGMYAEDREWDSAIEKYEDLLLWYPESRYSIPSLAAIPNMRLKALASPEYDRDALELAREALEEWLKSHAGHELEEQVRLDHADAMRRLADNDLSVGRFYRTVDNYEGAEYHARRAIEEARLGSDERQLEECEDLLRSVLPESSGASQ